MALSMFKSLTQSKVPGSCSHTLNDLATILWKVSGTIAGDLGKIGRLVLAFVKKKKTHDQNQSRGGLWTLLKKHNAAIENRRQCTIKHKAPVTLDRTIINRIAWFLQIFAGIRSISCIIYDCRCIFVVTCTHARSVSGWLDSGATAGPATT